MPLTIAVSGLHTGENTQPGCGVIRSLRRRYEDLRIVGLVYDVLESGIYSHDCADVIYQMPLPKTGSEALRARLEYIFAQQPIDILIPTLDSEIHGYLKLASFLNRRGVRTLMPTSESWQACQKPQLPELAQKCDCLMPKSTNVGEFSGLARAAHQIGYPLMVKGSCCGAVKVFTEAALFECFDYFISLWGAPVVLQELLTGGEFDVMAVADGQGDAGGYCAIRKTIVSEKGKGFGGITIRDSELESISRRLIRTLPWRGAIELEFIKRDKDNEYYLIEINPRFPAWVDFPSMFDHNLPALMVETLLGGAVPVLPPCEVGKFFVRHSVDLLGDVTQLGQLTTLGELHIQQSGTKASLRN